jgi:hypothetical protein
LLSTLAYFSRNKSAPKVNEDFLTSRPLKKQGSGGIFVFSSLELLKKIKDKNLKNISHYLLLTM